MEMIGVVAIIAILASMATPLIFESIRNARVSAQAEEVNTMRTAVANYFRDTGDFPQHSNELTVDNWRNLLRDDSSDPITGWDGPYIEKLPQNYIGTGDFRVRTLTTSGAEFDLDGDGTPDISEAVLIELQDVDPEQARKLSDLYDGDGEVLTGNGAWDAAGKVKTQSNGDVRIFVSEL